LIKKSYALAAVCSQPNIFQTNLEELKQILSSWDEKSFHAKQIFSWIYQRGAKDFSEMTDLPKSLRDKLRENFSFFALKPIEVLKSSDGTEKFLFELSDGNLIEAVSIPAKGRTTGCVSSQAGCKFSCRFCASGMQGFMRNLTSAEIIQEVAFLKQNSSDKLTHIVFMGTGEPLDNYDEVLHAIRIINAKDGFNIGARRITISTAGLIPGMERLAKEGIQIELSVSLHAADDATRNRLMPINKKYPLKELIAACKKYISETNRQVTFEYILIKNLNSGLQNALNLGRILEGMNCKVNLIPANTVKELDVVAPGREEALLFKEALLKSGVHVTLRMPRGGDINAACGQLRLKHGKK